MGCCCSQGDYLTEYESKRKEFKSKYYSNLLDSKQPSNFNAEYIPKSKIGQNKLRRKFKKTIIVCCPNYVN